MVVFGLFGPLVFLFPCPLFVFGHLLPALQTGHVGKFTDPAVAQKTNLPTLEAPVG